MRLLSSALALALLGSAWAAQAQDVPPLAVVADAPADAAFPARLLQVRYPTGGVDVPARVFVAAGAGPHPTVLLLHGFPGTELNLDLARAIQRAGWNVMAVHYRGVWGAPGQFSLNNTIEDARAALSWLRAPERQSDVDPSRIVVLGHSMGGFDTVMIGDDSGVAGFVTLSAWDAGAEAAKLTTPEARTAAQAEFADDLSFTNMTFASMADEIVAGAQAWDWDRNAAEMAGRPVLVIDSNDGLAPRGDAVFAAVTRAGGPAPTRLTFDTDHSYNDHRIALASAIVTWLEAEFP
jgi:acetyl esterase/lipase